MRDLIIKYKICCSKTILINLLQQSIKIKSCLLIRFLFNLNSMHVEIKFN